MRDGGTRVESRNPANLDEVVCEALLGDADTFADACRAARAAQPGWAATPAAGARQGDRADRPAGGGQQGGAGAPAHARDRQALPGVAGRGAGGGRHLRLLRLRGAAPVRPDRAERDAGQAAVHVPQPGRRGGDHHGRQLPGGRARPGTWCRPCCAATRSSGSRRSTRPRSARRSTELFLAGGLPDGVLNLVQCDGPTAFEGLERALDEGLVDKVGFTGSSAVGSRIGELCGRHVQSPCLELGGKNPLVVMPDADLDLAVEGALFSGFGTAGQRCTSLGTVIVHESVHDEFMRRFTRAVEEAADRRPVRRGALRADDPRALPRALPRLARADPRPPLRSRARRATGRITRRQPARRVRRRPGRRALLPPDDRGRRDDRGRPLLAPRRSARSWAWRVRRLRRGDGARQRRTATGSRRRSTRTTRSRRSASAAA